MYRASLTGLLTVVLCSTAAFGQVPAVPQQGIGYPLPATVEPAYQQQESEYVYSEQVTCTCGQVNENYAGGPRQCSGCGTPLPAPPALESVIDTADYVAASDQQPQIQQVDYTLGEICEMANSSSNSAGSCFSRLDRLFDGADTRGMSQTLLATPNMIGTGFGGFHAGPHRTNLSFVQPTNFTFLNVPGTLVGAFAGGASNVLYNVPGNVANPDYLSVAGGLLVGGFWQFAVTEAVPAPDALLPAGATFVNAQANQVTQAAAGVITTGDLWNIVLNANQAVMINVPNAANAGASVVGRSRIAQNNSAIPRTRVYFTMDHISDVKLQSGGVDVTRFTPGIEYAMNNASSIEYRVPFASTLSTDVLLDGNSSTGRSELGDMFLAYKRILCSSRDYVCSAGVSVTLPSSNDLSGFLGGNRIMMVENQSVHLMPFFGSIVRMRDRCFYQGFMQLDFDATGNQLWVDNGAGLVRVGRIRDTNRLYSSSALGYWCRKRGEKPDAFFSAIACTFEVHSESTLESSSARTAGPITFGNNIGRSSIVNGLLGTTLEVTPGETIAVGYSIPFGDDTDSYSDGQFRLLWNRFL